MKSVSIFTGAGGLDIGMELAGFDTVSAVEIHPAYFNTLITNQSRNIPGAKGRTLLQNTKIFNADIRDIRGEQLMCGENDIDCLVGGPPCQSFSSAGKQLSIFDERGSLIFEYLRILSEIRPKTFLFENVRGLITARGNKNMPGEILSQLLQRFKHLGYSCNVALLNSADYGACQRRVRCFIIGSKNGISPDFPQPTHTDTKKANIFNNDLPAWLTLGDFLKEHADDNPDNWVRPTASLHSTLVNLPDGSGIKSPGRAEITRPNGHWGYRQGTFIADKTKPARTVTGSSSQDWIRLEDGSLRRLTFNEVKKLQGFPDAWEFCGSKANKFQQVGNAVPIVFGKAIGQQIAQFLEGRHEIVANDQPLPKNIENAIKYTIRDNLRNGSCRVRFKNWQP